MSRRNLFLLQTDQSVRFHLTFLQFSAPPSVLLCCHLFSGKSLPTRKNFFPDHTAIPLFPLLSHQPVDRFLLSLMVPLVLVSVPLKVVPHTRQLPRFPTLLMLNIPLSTVFHRNPLHRKYSRIQSDFWLSSRIHLSPHILCCHLHKPAPAGTEAWLFHRNAGNTHSVLPEH